LLNKITDFSLLHPKTQNATTKDIIKVRNFFIIIAAIV